MLFGKDTTDSAQNYLLLAKVTKGGGEGERGKGQRQQIKTLQVILPDDDDDCDAEQMAVDDGETWTVFVSMVLTCLSCRGGN